MMRKRIIIIIIHATVYHLNYQFLITTSYTTKNYVYLNNTPETWHSLIENLIYSNKHGSSYNLEIFTRKRLFVFILINYTSYYCEI